VKQQQRQQEREGRACSGAAAVPRAVCSQDGARRAPLARRPRAAHRARAASAPQRPSAPAAAVRPLVRCHAAATPPSAAAALSAAEAKLTLTRNGVPLASAPRRGAPGGVSQRSGRVRAARRGVRAARAQRGWDALFLCVLQQHRTAAARDAPAVSTAGQARGFRRTGREAHNPRHPWPQRVRHTRQQQKRARAAGGATTRTHARTHAVLVVHLPQLPSSRGMRLHYLASCKYVCVSARVRSCVCMCVFALEQRWQLCRVSSAAVACARDGRREASAPSPCAFLLASARPRESAKVAARHAQPGARGADGTPARWAVQHASAAKKEAHFCFSYPPTPRPPNHTPRPAPPRPAPRRPHRSWCV
jgi:hypothetical protein